MRPSVGGVGHGFRVLLAKHAEQTFHLAAICADDRDEFVPLLALPNLRRVSISECPTVTDACVPELKKLTHLNFINLYATQVSAEHRAKYTGKPL